MRSRYQGTFFLATRKSCSQYKYIIIRPKSPCLSLEFIVRYSLIVLVLLLCSFCLLFCFEFTVLYILVPGDQEIERCRIKVRFESYDNVLVI